MRSDETVITPKLSLSVEKAKRLSTRPDEMPTENSGNFTMDFLTGLDSGISQQAFFLSLLTQL
ncbi:MAG: hypothetical protein LUG90_09955 [Clostridiaceae bacterium]|nr:hypothetical protein [Clostridiaceae bacterium]